MINLRGAIMPVIDLRNRLGLGVTVPETRHVIVVVECRDRLAGILVDAVSETFTVSREHLQPTPNLGTDELRFIQAIISLDSRLITLSAHGRRLPGPGQPGGASPASRLERQRGGPSGPPLFDFGSLSSRAERSADPGPPEAHAFTRRSRIGALRACPG